MKLVALVQYFRDGGTYDAFDCEPVYQVMRTGVCVVELVSGFHGIIEAL
ncbi:hypothetical protein SAMN05421788_106316 [Filimonas lacunae]|uniref:Uncharacterized protein n=1 Tax=Filimonas lacunae TaxID=477680 RepID=A0A1N7QRE8_9BACT|nr:hypothetical protein [Filimonas lacunae]SIT25462.1 hypothetical protein SAMN05421788_106316 [Filimonas lacunae]